jgi:predicted 2-oxoglutarate/Fe(II)-dependent dioxygenase YbiX
MTTDLKSYIKHTKNFLDLNICKKTVDEMNNIQFQEHRFGNPSKKTLQKLSDNQELSVSWSYVSTKMQIESKIYDAILDYQKFISPNIKVFSGFQGYSPIRFNKYSENKKMAFHIDHIHSLFDGVRKGIPILSVLGALNENYEGGEFVIFDDYKIKFNTGDLLIFPSIFLYPHRVEPVTKGVRYTYISWVW